MQTADRLVAQTVRRGGAWLTVLVVTSLGGAVLELSLPYVLGRTVDALISGDPAAGGRAAACIALVLGLVACESLGVWAAGASSAQASAWLRIRIAGQVLKVGPRMTRRFAEGDLVTRLGLNAEEAGRAPEAVVTAAALLLPTAGSIIALALIDPWLALTLVAGLALVGFVVRAFLRDTTTIAGGYQEAQGDIAARLIDALSGARTIAAAGTADAETRRVLAALPRLRAHGLALWRANARAGVRAGLAVPLLEVAVLGIGGLRLASGGLTVGELYAAARYAVLGAGLSAALGHAGRLARARAAAARVSELLAERPVSHGVRSLPAGPGTLEFRGVVLPGRTGAIDVVLPGGSATAVVGRSGAGKSLFAAAAGRLADPVEGTVLLDGVPLPELSREALRRAIGYAPERPVLVGDTVADAIGLGCRPGADAVPAAARAACADGFVRPLPQGYATRLEDAPMSGGERQRIGLARAFAQGERLLVLDDATSSLDTATERQVGAALTGELSGRTRLLVAHRAAIAARADRVIWLEDGRVRAHDHHRVLWRDPDYRAVFQAAPAPEAEGAAG
ncbi:ABC transporter transmembrane domain-containing protein [Actinomadura scrupuli]|uniref:ABC transporter transmembrane domain-containing protein n=1 Tax=Actinomadura scrupuli TaxID=559629 RepID=UPI003D98BD9A